jgi:hypothetical protein
MEAISIATGNYAETVGGALVDALITASGSNGVEGFVTKIDKLAQATSNSIKEFQKFAFITAYAFNLKNVFKGGDEFTRALNEFTSAQQMAGAAAFNPQNNAVTGYKLDEKAAKDAKKQADIQAKLLKQSIDNQKKITAENKKQAALKKAGSIFDLEQVQLIAALKGKLSDEDRKRVELQFALLIGNTKEAQALTFEIAKAQGLTTDLAKFLASLPDAKNPFTSWDSYLDALQKKAAQISNTLPAFGTTGAMGNPNFETGTTAQIVSELDKSTAYILQLAKETDALIASIAGSSSANPQALKNLPSSTGYGTNFRRAEEASNMTGPIQMVVQIDGKTIATALQDSSLSGIGSSVNRTGR